MKQIFLLVTTVISISISAQERFAKTITSADLETHLLKIASEEMQGRETATEGQRKAAAYIEDQFKKLNLKPVLNEGYQQAFPVYRDSLANVKFNINNVELTYDTDYAVTNNSGFNFSLQSPEIVFAGFGISDTTRDDYAGVNANGKIVAVWARSDYFTLQRAAKKNGVAALIIIQERFPKGPTSRKGRMYVHDFRRDSIPNTYVVTDSVAHLIFGTETDSLKKSLKNNAPAAKTYTVPVHLELQKSTEHLESTNVIGMLEGTDKKDEAIVMTAHYDHLGMRDSAIYYGADDDGSGTVSVIEIAEAFAKAAEAGKAPRRSIIFMAVSGEEKGLWGSDYYADHPAFPLEKTSANINIDMIGRIEKGRKGDSLNYIYVVGDNKLSTDLRTISESQNNKHLKLKFDYKYNDPHDPERIYYRSDHYNFAKKGVPAIFYFSGLHDDYHRPTDTPDKIRYDLLTRRGQMIFYTAWEIANRNEMLKRDLPLP
jgi:hypothetical protein